MMRDGSYNVPIEYLIDQDMNIVKATLKRNNYLEYSEIKGYLKKKKYIKNKIKDL
jgi:hypothetical protein